MSRREIISSFLLAFYLLVLLRPIVPCLEYQLKRDFIQQELCTRLVPTCAGNCYLSKQLKNAQNDDLRKQLTFALGEVFILPSSPTPLLLLPDCLLIFPMRRSSHNGPSSGYYPALLKPPIYFS